MDTMSCHRGELSSCEIETIRSRPLPTPIPLPINSLHKRLLRNKTCEQRQMTIPERTTVRTFWNTSEESSHPRRTFPEHSAEAVSTTMPPSAAAKMNTEHGESCKKQAQCLVPDQKRLTHHLLSATNVPKVQLSETLEQTSLPQWPLYVQDVEPHPTLILYKAQSYENHKKVPLDLHVLSKYVKQAVERDEQRRRITPVMDRIVITI